MLFREKVLALAKERRLDLKEIAVLAHIPYSTLRNYLSDDGRGAPSAPKGISLAGVLRVPVEWLFDDRKGWPPPPAWQSAPPIPIYPWPPDGITWYEVQRAIWEYLMSIHERGIAENPQAPPEWIDRTRGLIQALSEMLGHHATPEGEKLRSSPPPELPMIVSSAPSSPAESKQRRNRSSRKPR